MQQFNELSINERNDILNAMRASLIAESREEGDNETSAEGDPRRGWLIISDE
jgi:hypothetical protein